MTGWVELILGMLGNLASAFVYLAVCALAVYLQYREYRRHWPYSGAAWWAIKLATPASVALIVLLALALFNTDGMEGLAVFYSGLFVALLLAPLGISLIARMLGVGRLDALRASGSLVLTFMVVWFAGAGALNSVSNMGTGDLEGRAEYIAFRRAAENAPEATSEIRHSGTDVFLLPDGSRLVHLAFAIQPGYGIHTADVRTQRTHGGGNSESFNSTLGSCATDGIYHMTTVLNESEHFDVRLRFHAGSPETMVEFRGDYRFPRADSASLRSLVLEYANGELRTPVPLPAHAVSVFTDGGVLKVETLLPPREERVVGMHPRARCFAGALASVSGVDKVEATLYSEEQYRKLQYELPLRRLD